MNKSCARVPEKMTAKSLFPNKIDLVEAESTRCGTGEMRGLLDGLDRLGADDGRRLLADEGVNQEAYAQKDERDAQDLSHVEHHVFLETDLRLLDKFDEETAAEAPYHEDADERPAPCLVQTPFVYGHQHKAQEEIRAGLVKLGRMLGLGLAAKFEDKAPREIGHVAVNLRVEEVAQADEACCECHRDAQMVEQPDKVEMLLRTVFAGIPPHAQQQHYGAAMACEAAFPRHENLQEALPAAEIVVGLVEYAMSQPGADDGTEKERIQQRVKKVFAHALPLEEPLENIPAKYEPAHEKQRIPSQPEISYMENDRIDMPMYVKDLQHNYLHFTHGRPHGLKIAARY